MQRRRVLVLSRHTLLGESLECILGNLEDVEVIGSWLLDETVFEQVVTQPPDLLLIADEEDEVERVTTLAVKFLEKYPNLPVIRVKLGQNVVQVYTTQTVPARVADLVDVIRRLPLAHLNSDDNP